MREASTLGRVTLKDIDRAVKRVRLEASYVQGDGKNALKLHNAALDLADLCRKFDDQYVGERTGRG